MRSRVPPADRAAAAGARPARGRSAARGSADPADLVGREPLPRLDLAVGEVAATLRGAAVAALPVQPGPDGPRPGAGAAIGEELGLDLPARLADQRASGEPGEIVSLTAAGTGVRTVLLVGVGSGSPADLRRAAAALARRTRDAGPVATTIADGRDAAGVAAVAEALALAGYRYRWPGAAPRGGEPAPVTLAVSDPVEPDPLPRALAAARATWLARDLANTPSLVKTPAWFADRAVALAAGRGLQVRVRDERELAAEGFGGILAVGSGSARPPRLLELRHRPRGARRHVVLVGKGITFDSGGLSLKPREGMVPMKTDMAGGAAVLAAMSELAGLGVPVSVTGLVPLAENMPSGSAVRPGDVVRHYGGRTSEVLNTDAEGRLVLADALAYAAARLRPDVLVDLATLTGAASVGLGRRHGALYASRPELSAALLAAAAEAGERLWPMPLVEDYRAALDSPVADLANVSRNPHVQGGSIVAALFLREFTAGLPWAHLDIAGPARSDADEDEQTKGATGFGVRLLLRWLESGAPG